MEDDSILGSCLERESLFLLMSSSVLLSALFVILDSVLMFFSSLFKEAGVSLLDSFGSSCSSILVAIGSSSLSSSVSLVVLFSSSHLHALSVVLSILTCS